MTSSSRIFIKIMPVMQEMMEGMKTLAERFKDPEVKRGCEGMFLTDVLKNIRFAINYFTSIGLGVIMEEMRVYLKVGSLATFFLGRFEILLSTVNNLECPLNIIIMEQ